MYKYFHFFVNYFPFWCTFHTSRKVPASPTSVQLTKLCQDILTVPFILTNKGITAKGLIE